MQLTTDEKLEHFDFTEGLRRLQGNRGLYIRLLVDFAGRYRDFATEVRQALTRRDAAQAHEQVHFLKGLAGNLSATDLYRAAGALDGLLKESPPDWHRIEACFQVFEDALEQSVQSAEGLNQAHRIESGEAGGPAALPGDLACEVAGRIRKSVELGDIMAIIEVADDSALGGTVRKRIMGLVDGLDFEGLSRLADELERRPT